MRIEHDQGDGDMGTMRKIAGMIALLAAFMICFPIAAICEESVSPIIPPPSISARHNIAVVPSRNLIIAGSCDAQYLFRIDNLRPVETRSEPGCSSFFVAESGSIILKTFTDGMTINSLKTGEKTGFIPGFHKYSLGMVGAFTPDESALIAGYEHKPDILRLDLATKRWSRIGSHRQGLNPRRIIVSRDGSLAISMASYPGKPSEAIVWDLGSNRSIATYPAEAAAITKDGAYIALAMKIDDGSFKLEIRGSRDRKLIGSERIGNLAAYGDGRRPGNVVSFLGDDLSLGFLIGGDYSQKGLEFRIWNPAHGQRSGFRFGADDIWDAISIRPDIGSVLVLRSNGISKYEIATGRPARENPTASPVHAVAASFSTDVKSVAVADYNSVTVINLQDGSVTESLVVPERIGGATTKSIKHISFLSGSRALAIVDESSVYRWDSVSGELRPLYSNLEGLPSIDGLTVSRDGQRLAFEHGGTAYVISADNGAILHKFAVDKLSGLNGRKLAFVDDDQRLLVGGFQIEVFDLQKQGRILNYALNFYVDKTKYYRTWARYIAKTDYSDGSWLIGMSGAPGGQMLAYRNGRIIKHFGAGRPGTPYLSGQANAALSLEGSQMAFARGNEIRTSNSSFESWKLVGVHAAEVLALGSSGNGSLVSVSKDGQIRFGKPDSENDLVRMHLYEGAHWVALTPEGFFAGTKDAVQHLLIRIGATEAVPLESLYQALYRPDLVREKLAGDPKGLVREAAAKLDLNKVIASGAAPRVSIVTPSGNAGSDEVTVEASIAEQSGGGIGRIEWRVNGTTLGVESRGLERLPVGSAASPAASRPPVVVKRTLALEPGENRVEVVAYNGRDLIASDPARIVLKWDGEKSAVPPKLHVLAVGVNDYWDSRLKLSYAVPDARALADALRQAGNSLYQSVEVTSVLDDKVTIDNLDKVFAEIGGKVHPRDVFVFFLAGHGKTVDGRYHFLPQNFRYEDESSIVKRGIDQERFQAWFAKIPARKSILLYDTCESGSLTGERVQQRGIERVAALEKMTRAMGRTVLSASTDDAPALEGYRGHGVFTYALLDGLQAADTNGNGLIEVTELAAFIDQKVPDLSYQAFKMRQIPQMKIVGSSFPVVSRTSVLQADGPAASNMAPVASIPAAPTHVVVSQSPMDVFVEAARGSAIVRQLAPGTTVTLVETANGWQLVAKDGRKLGYVEGNMLARIQ